MMLIAISVLPVVNASLAGNHCFAQTVRVIL